MMDLLDETKKAADRSDESDYIVDGLRYCSKCFKPKQMRIEWLGRNEIVGIMCDCEVIRMEENNERLERIRKERLHARRYKLSFGSRKAAGRFEIDDGRQSETMMLVKDYADNFDNRSKNGRGLLLFGSTGQGKTFAAECVANKLFDEGRNVIMRSLSQVVLEIQGAGFDSEEYVDRLASCSLLILDDLGTERMTEFAQTSVFAVIDARYSARKPMVITTNLTGEELSQTDDLNRQRLFGRILERCMPIEFPEVRSRIEPKNFV